MNVSPSFSFETTRKVICEDGAALKVGEIVAGLGATRAFVVTDRGLLETGLLRAPLAAIEAAGVTAILYTEVQADPPETAVVAAVEAAREAGADAVIGFGGGSSLDTAKLVALLAATGEHPSEVYGVNVSKGPRLALVLVPTTAGTGSEVTQYSIVTTPTDEKKAVAASLLYPDAAVLDATLTLGLPPRITAMTGVDAMVHAIEAYTSKHKKNPVSDTLALKALELLSGSILTAVQNGQDIDARRAMLQGSLLAGMAFANSPVGAVHALAYPLGGLFHVPHGLSNALVLGPVLEFNLPAADGHYAELRRALPPWLTEAKSAGAEGFVEAIRTLVSAMPMEARLADVGVTPSDIPALAKDAMNVQRLLVNNPREVAYDDCVRIYESVL